MKPTITSVNDGYVSTDVQPQSINIKGTGFVKDHMVLIVEGPDPKNRNQIKLQVSAKGWPQGLEVESETELNAVVNFPKDTNGPSMARVFSDLDGIASEWFRFPVH